MNNRIFLYIFLCFGCVLSSCNNQSNTVAVHDFASVSVEYVQKVTELENKIDPTDIDSFLHINDSVSTCKQKADSALNAVLADVNDTLFIPFKQTKNTDKISIQQVWVVDVDYDQLYIEASVKALDNSAIHGPYTSLSAFDSEGKRIGVGGGIGGSSKTKLRAGEVYIFTGKIDNIHRLDDFAYLQFDENIKKW
ncbi:MAG: hypothetical protein R6U95_04105 [Bacteroidales bacterium]